MTNIDIDIFMQETRNKEYYRNLLIQIGEIIGKEAYISDDGSIQDSVLCAKLPELVQDLVDKEDEHYVTDRKRSS